MALAYLIAGVCLLIGTVLWAEGGGNKKLTVILILVGIACIIASFLVTAAAGVKL